MSDNQIFGSTNSVKDHNFSDLELYVFIGDDKDLMIQLYQNSYNYHYVPGTDASFKFEPKQVEQVKDLIIALQSWVDKRAVEENHLEVFK